MASTLAMKSLFADAISVRESLYVFLAPVWVEVCFLVCFALGFVVLRVDLVNRKRSQPKKVVDDFPSHQAFDPRLQQALEKEEDASVIRELWAAGSLRTPTPPQSLRAVVQALASLDRQAVAMQIIEHIRCHAGVLANTRTLVVVLDVLARAGCVDAMMQIVQAVSQEFGVQPSLQIFEILLGGFATAGEEAKVAAITEAMRAKNISMSARGLSLTIKGFLKNGKVNAVIHTFAEMKALGFQVPLFAVTQLFRIACDASRAPEVFDATMAVAPLCTEAVLYLMEDCCRRGDLELAGKVERAAREQEVQFTTGVYDALLKVYTMAGDVRVLKLFEEAQAVPHVHISDGLCVGLLARCADVKFLRFAEEIMKFSRARGKMTISIYSALMKVYAYCGMYAKACDLYDQITEDGLEPDAMMYGCLMKFSVECGRTDLSRKLSETVPKLDIKNYMSLIRAAGHDKDVKRAFDVFGRLKSSGVHIDVAAYNCMLDVCVSAGDLERAMDLVSEIKTRGHMDVVTYNTLLKGLCQRGDLSKGKDLLREMKASGVPPNDVSYNCLINAAVNIGGHALGDAWDIVSMMDADGVKVDHYTISILMKALKRSKNQSDARRVLALLDRSCIEVLSDEILMRSVLETCVKHNEIHRLEVILASYQSTKLKCSIHTYGALIKAASATKRLPLCWQLWYEMVEERRLEPNEIALGCMLDALVTNRDVDKAVDLLVQWKSRIPANIVMYSTIMKGLANTHQADRAMKLWRELRAEGHRMNVVVYNAVIDAQARVGAMENVSEILSAMENDGVHPDVISMSTIVKGYCIKGDVDMACKVFRDMQRSKMVTDPIVYNTLLDGCTRNNRFDVADALLRDMEENDIKPTNFTMGVLMKMWGRRRQLDKAFETLETFPRKYGFVANAQVKTGLICSCLNNNAISRAFVVLEGMKQAGQCLDGKVHSAMIAGLVRQGHSDKAVALVDEAYGLGGSRPCLAAGASIEADALDKLVRALAQSKDGEKLAMPLLDRMRSAKVPVSSHLYSLVLGSEGSGARGEGRVGGGARPRSR